VVRVTRPLSVLTRPLRDSTLVAALRGGSWALVGTFIGRLANVGALLLAARHLGSGQFGSMSLALSTTLVITSVSALGLPVAAQKLVAEAREVDPVRRDRLIDITLGMTIAVGVVTMIGGVLASTWVAGTVLGQPDIVPLVAVASILILTTPMTEVLAGLLAALEKFRTLGFFRAAHGTLCGALLVPVLVTASGALSALWALAAAEAIACGLGLWLVSTARGPRRAARCGYAELLIETRSLLRVSLPALIASVTLQPALWVGQVLLSRQPDGLAHVGTFAVAMRWHSIALFVPVTMGSVLLPMLGRLRATGRTMDARTLFLRYGALIVVLSTATCLGLIAFAGTLMGLQGPEYSTASGVLIVLAVATVPVALNSVLSDRALAEGRLALWVGSDLVLAVVLVATAVALVPAFGGIGLAWSYLAALIATCLVLLPIARLSWTPVEEPG
jgi:O-antigen/teichoic acid export membrane protein